MTRIGLAVLGLLLSSAVVGQPALTDAAKRMGFEARQLWVDASANWSWLTDAAKIEDFCERARRAGFNEVILDVKPIVGRTLFPSRVAGELTEWKDVRKPEGLDILGTFLEAAHKRGLRCMASVNTFSEGHGYFERAGSIWDHPEWASVVLGWTWVAERGSVSVDLGRADPSAVRDAALFTRNGLPSLRKLPSPAAWATLGPDGTVLQTGSAPPPEEGWTYLLAGWCGAELFRLLGEEGTVRLPARLMPRPVTASPSDYVALFVSPLQPDARRRQIDLLREIVTRYPVDGIVLDRMRFEGLEAGFEEPMREAFARDFGEPGSWPTSILRPPAEPGGAPERGPRWSEYQILRGGVIRDFLAEARSALREAGRNVPVGVYVGGWYDQYEDVGVNWAGDALPPPYSWALPEYRFTGYAGLSDFLCAGAYYKAVEPEENPDAPLETVAGATRRAVEVAGGDTLVYGTLYLLEYEGDTDRLRRAIRAARDKSLGVCVFDASYILRNDWWQVFAEEFAGADGEPPHAEPSLLQSLRTAFPARTGQVK